MVEQSPMSLTLVVASLALTLVIRLWSLDKVCFVPLDALVNGPDVSRQVIPNRGLVRAELTLEKLLHI